MTDIQKLKEMLDRANIDYKCKIITLEQLEEDTRVYGGKNKPTKADEQQTITVEGGYVGFVSVFVFDMAGNLKEIGAWE